MDLAYIKRLIKLLSESDVDEIEIEEQGNKIRLVKHQNSRAEAVPNALMQVPPRSAPAYEVPPPPTPPAGVTVPAAAPEAALSSTLHEVKSPIVGTFYRSPAPEAPPFVQIGSTVEAGSVLCIVEAMKLMNEIESDRAGKIVKIMVENGQPVEYDQTLFLVETS